MCEIAAQERAGGAPACVEESKQTSAAQMDNNAIKTLLRGSGKNNQ